MFRIWVFFLSAPSPSCWWTEIGFVYRHFSLAFAISWCLPRDNFILTAFVPLWKCCWGGCWQTRATGKQQHKEGLSGAKRYLKMCEGACCLWHQNSPLLIPPRHLSSHRRMLGSVTQRQLLSELDNETPTTFSRRGFPFKAARIEATTLSCLYFEHLAGVYDHF